MGVHHCKEKKKIMYRFFIEECQVDGAYIWVEGDDVNHIRNVLRMKAGERVLLCSESGMEYESELVSLEGDKIQARILDIHGAESELKTRIVLFQGLPKGDKMDLVIQKAIELGASEIVPVKMKRCVVKLDEKKAAEMARGLSMVLVPYEAAEGMEYSRQLVKEVKGRESVGIFIGPEGGFEPAEIEELRESGGQILSLGKRILRTETAGMAMLSVLMFELEE